VALKEVFDFVVAVVVRSACEFRRDWPETDISLADMFVSLFAADNQYHCARVSFVLSHTEDVSGISYQEKSYQSRCSRRDNRGGDWQNRGEPGKRPEEPADGSRAILRDITVSKGLLTFSVLLFLNRAARGDRSIRCS
jgi:hypothetical protein